MLESDWTVKLHIFGMFGLDVSGQQWGTGGETLIDIQPVVTAIIKIEIAKKIIKIRLLEIISTPPLP